MESAGLFYKLKRLIESVSPEAYDSLRRRFHRHLLHHMLRKMTNHDGLVIQSGPFRGMRYLPELMIPDSFEKYALFPKILGSYEEEMHPLLVQMLGRGYDRVINIGCTDGYYSVGVSRKLPDAHTYVFDPDGDARRICQRMAQYNDVADRVTVRGDCAISELTALVQGRTLVICDYAGSEIDLLRPDLVPGLAHSDMIVKLHNHVDPTIPHIVSERFARTHEMITLTSRDHDRDFSSFRLLDGLSLYKRQLAVEEWRLRPPLWSIMTPKDGNQPLS